MWNLSDVRWVIPLLAVLALVGCNGGTVDLHALQNDSESIDSLACEAALLADEVAHTASPSTFTRVHAGDLENRASNFADALSKRPTTPGIEKATRKEATKAAQIAALLNQLEHHPTDTALAARLKTRFEKQGECA